MAKEQKLKNQNITFVRGDSFPFGFHRLDANNEIITSLPDKLLFTVRTSSDKTLPFVFQKSLEDGITYNQEDKKFHVMIAPSDTENLDYINYFWDLEVTTETYRKTIAVGRLYFIKDVS